MTKDEIRATILANIAADVEYYRSSDFQLLAGGHYRNRTGNLLLQKAMNAEDGCVPYKPSEWLGRPLTGSERVQFCKVLRAMADEGLLVCYVDSRGRTTHIALTDTGEQVATEFVAIAE